MKGYLIRLKVYIYMCLFVAYVVRGLKYVKSHLRLSILINLFKRYW